MPDLTTLLLVGVSALLLAGLLSPFEALGWWAGWYGSEERAPEPAHDVPASRADRFVVFLSGIHSVSGEAFAEREVRLLERLRGALPDAEILEVFPYSVTNRALTGQRIFSRFWRWALAGKMSRRQLAGLAGMLINLRNAWQVAVSADRRYGPMYDQGSADLIAQALLDRGYRPGSGAPVLLIGYSGGGQVALGAATALAERIGTTPTVLSLGGVMSSPRSLHRLERVVHLRGRRDGIARLGAAAFPGRWPWVRWSAWNRAKKEGIVRVVDMGPMDHTGRDGYLDGSRRLPDGRSYLDATVDAVVAVAHGEVPPDVPLRQTVAS